MKKSLEIISEQPKKRGPKPLPSGELRRFCLPVRVSRDELASLKIAAGKQGITAYVRGRLGL